MIFDPLYFIIIAPGLLLALFATWKVKSTFKRYTEVPLASGWTGAQIAEEVLRRSGVQGVRVEEHEGWLSDHYDPGERVVRLSHDVYHGQSISAAGVAAHEAGHALQHAQGYAAMKLRQNLVLPANLGSSLSYIVIFGGFFLQMAGLIWVGIALFSAVVLFQLVTLPVEFNASSRARLQLVQLGLVNRSEEKGVGKVLSAAAMTYVAALITSILTLVYFLIRFAGVGRSDD
jgi:Zn-dependent membrane protease YugP